MGGCMILRYHQSCVIRTQKIFLEAVKLSTFLTATPQPLKMKEKEEEREFLGDAAGVT